MATQIHIMTRLTRTKGSSLQWKSKMLSRERIVGQLPSRDHAVWMVTGILAREGAVVSLESEFLLKKCIYGYYLIF